jgi:ribulose-bisphosphate carboxylase large chain
LSISYNQGVGDVEYGKINGILLLVEVLRLFDGPSTNILDMWRMLGRSLTDGGLVVGTIITVDQHLVYVAHARPLFV